MQQILAWFEIPVSDFARAKKFYEAVAGHTLKEEQMGPYKMGFFQGEQGVIGGAIVHGEHYQPSASAAVIYFNGGDDLNHFLAKVEPAGGKVTMPKTPISPENGFFAFFHDTEGNRLGVWSLH